MNSKYIKGTIEEIKSLTTLKLGLGYIFNIKSYFFNNSLFSHLNVTSKIYSKQHTKIHTI